MALIPKFEVVVYNKEVRRLVEFGDSHDILNDDWADLHYIKVTAGSESEARSKMEKKHPPGEGYVIESISPVGNSDYE